MERGSQNDLVAFQSFRLRGDDIDGNIGSVQGGIPAELLFAIFELWMGGLNGEGPIRVVAKEQRNLRRWGSRFSSKGNQYARGHTGSEIIFFQLLDLVRYVKGCTANVFAREGRKRRGRGQVRQSAHTVEIIVSCRE